MRRRTGGSKSQQERTSVLQETSRLKGLTRPPSPMADRMGRAISVMRNAKKPLKSELHAMALDDRPTLASTR